MFEAINLPKNSKIRAASTLLGLSLAIAGCGNNKSTKAESIANHPGDNCTYLPANHVKAPDSGQDSTNPDYCIIESFPMGDTDLLDGGNGELGLIDVRIKLGSKLLDCVLPKAHPNTGTSPQIRVETFSLKDSCQPYIPPTH